MYNKAVYLDRTRHIARKPSPKKVHEVRFTNPGSKEDKLRPYPDVFQAGPCKDPDVFLADLLTGLDLVNPNCALYKTLKSAPADISAFLHLFEPNFCYSDHIDLNSYECQKYFLEFFNNLHVSEDVVQILEEGTRGQSLNQNWIDARVNLITASNFGNVCKRIKPEPDNLVAYLRRYKKIPNTKSIQYGRKNERKALKAYSKLHSKTCGVDVRLEDSGLVVNPKYPFLGASVDSNIKCSKCGSGVVEVKCPFGSNSSTLKWRTYLQRTVPGT